MMVEVVLGAVEAIIFFVHCSKNSIFTMIEKYKSLAAKKKKKKNIRAVRLTELYGDQGRKYLKVPSWYKNMGQSTKTMRPNTNLI